MKNIESEIKKIKHLFEYQLGDNKKLLREYDIDDDNKMSFIDELKSDGGEEIMNEIGVSLTNQEDVVNSLDNLEICQMSDMDSYVEKKFGQVVKEKFKDKSEEVLKTIKESINKFIDFLNTLTVKDLKKLFKNIKAKKSEAEKSEGGDEVLKEFFGTSMALVTLFGSFTMPALVLTIASVVLVTLIGLWLVNAILCSFNISLTSKKRCRVRSFEWGQCK
jgi:hypothetical protein